MPRIAAVLEFNKFPEIARKLPRETAQIVAETALAIETHAKLFVPVDTGNLRNSIQAQEESATQWVVATGVEYAEYVEFGTSRMAARPYMTPAAERERPHFMAKMRALESRLE